MEMTAINPSRSKQMEGGQTAQVLGILWVYVGYHCAHK
jgi:hypothetical protein